MAEKRVCMGKGPSDAHAPITDSGTKRVQHSSFFILSTYSSISTILILQKAYLPAIR
jgi:hypothetical protein